MSKYFTIASSPILQAVICIDEDEDEVKTLNCTNYEFCYYSNILVNRRCPQYCQIIVEAKKYAFGMRKTKANVRRLKNTI